MLKSSIDTYNDILNRIVDESQKRLSDDLVSIYSYGSVNHEGNYPKDVDLMYVIRTDNGHINPNNLVVVKDICEPYRSPKIDYYVYGEDEIPSDDVVGYSLFLSLFLLDYKSHAKLLYGRDIISEIGDIDVRKKAIELCNMFRRSIRHLILDQETNQRALDIFIGDLAGENTYFTQNLLSDFEDFSKWCLYCATMTAKSMLAFYGTHIVNKNEIREVFLDRFDETEEAIIFNGLLYYIQSIEDTKTQGPKRELLEKTLTFIESVSDRMENEYV